MSITNQNGDTLKAFARLTRDVRVIDGEVLRAGDTVETAKPNHASLRGETIIQSPRGHLVPLNADEATIATQNEDAAAAFACLTNTLRVVLDLEKPMEDDDRARIGRWLLGKLFEGEPGAVRTIRDLTVGELIDLLHDAKSPCIIV